MLRVVMLSIGRETRYQLYPDWLSGDRQHTRFLLGHLKYNGTSAQVSRRPKGGHKTTTDNDAGTDASSPAAAPN